MHRSCSFQRCNCSESGCSHHDPSGRRSAFGFHHVPPGERSASGLPSGVRLNASQPFSRSHLRADGNGPRHADRHALMNDGAHLIAASRSACVSLSNSALAAARLKSIGSNGHAVENIDHASAAFSPSGLLESVTPAASTLFQVAKSPSTAPFRCSFFHLCSWSGSPFSPI